MVGSETVSDQRFEDSDVGKLGFSAWLRLAVAVSAGFRIATHIEVGGDISFVTNTERCERTIRFCD